MVVFEKHWKAPQTSRSRAALGISAVSIMLS
jgi:hypothetical protein